MFADPNKGYVNDFQVNTGKENNVPERGLEKPIVKDLTRDNWGQNHNIYCDTSFTSVQLFQELLENKTYACGTIRANRKDLPPVIVRGKLKKQGDMRQQEKCILEATSLAQ